MSSIYVVTNIDNNKKIFQNSYNEEELQKAAQNYLNTVESMDRKGYFGSDMNIISGNQVGEHWTSMSFFYCVPKEISNVELVSNMFKMQKDYGFGWLFVTKIGRDNFKAEIMS